MLSAFSCKCARSEAVSGWGVDARFERRFNCASRSTTTCNIRARHVYHPLSSLGLTLSRLLTVVGESSISVYELVATPAGPICP